MRAVRFRSLSFVISIVVFLYLIWKLKTPSINVLDLIKNCLPTDISHLTEMSRYRYNATYPLSKPETVFDGVRYKIAIIADLDEERSKVTNKSYTWKSYLKEGYLTKLSEGFYKVEWTRQVTLNSNFNEKGRGLELSELCVYNGKLYTVDDRTGLVYQIVNNEVIPWVILMDGNGSNKKGFKSEWMTVKDGVLYIGGLGKEWTSKTGQFVNYHPLFVKSIDIFGGVMHHNWTMNYLNIRAKVGITFPGYMIHEAVAWSSINQRWYFLPRRMSTQVYNDVADERRATNVVISAASDFTDLRYTYVGSLDPTHGFSSFKFVPGSSDEIAVALKTREVEGKISTYITVFGVDTGEEMMEETLIANDKFEGIEFI